MALRRSLFPQVFLGLSLVLTILVLGACAKKEPAKKEAEIKTEGEKKSEGESDGGEPLLTPAGSLLYFKGGVGGDTSISTAPQAHTGGGPTVSTGDQVAWVLYGSALTVTSLTFPATTNCGASNVPAGWTPYAAPDQYKGYAFSVRSRSRQPERATGNGTCTTRSRSRMAPGPAATS